MYISRQAPISFSLHSEQFNENQGQVMEERQDGEVEGRELTSCHKNIKITTNCQILTDKKDSTIPKKDTLHPKQEATRDDSRGAFSI